MAFGGKFEEYKDSVAMLTRMPSEHKRGAGIGLAQIVVGMVIAAFMFTWSDALSGVLPISDTLISVILAVIMLVLFVNGVRRFNRELKQGRYEMTNRF